MIKLTTVQRRLIARTFVLGSLISAAVAAVEYFGLLTALELLIYDRRALWFQYCSPPPSQDIWFVHLDDESLKEVGRWPWPRNKLAAIVDELREAGAKVIALDILLSEPELPGFEQRLDGSFAKVDHDQILAATFERANNVVVPGPSLSFVEQHKPALRKEIDQLLLADPETDKAAVARFLSNKGFDAAEVEAAVSKEFLDSQQCALFERMTGAVAESDASRDYLLRKVVPRSTAIDDITDAHRLGITAYDRAIAWIRYERFMTPLPPGAPPLLQIDPASMLIPVPMLADAARYSGHIDFMPATDGKVRSIPMVVNVRGKLYPAMSLAIACATLDVPIAAIRLEEDCLVLPRPEGSPIRIPVRTHTDARHGTISGFMDILWFGGREWQKMYDFPAFKMPVRQEIMTSLWKVEQLRQDIGRNNHAVDEAILFFKVRLLKDDDLATRRALAGFTQDQYAAAIQRLLDDDYIVRNYKGIKRIEASETQLEELESLIITNYENLERVQKINARKLQLIDEARSMLRKKFAGKLVIVGAVAATLGDLKNTSIHNECPGPVIQSVVVNSILTQHFLRSAPAWLAPLLTIGAGALVTWYVAYFSSYRALLATLLFGIAYFLFNGYVLYDWSNRIVPVAGALTAAVVVWGLLTLYRFIFETAERTRITRRFRSYVDPAIVDYVVDHPDAKLDGEVKEITVVFTDLAGFTSVSERLKERAVTLLNEYMSCMLPIIRANNGLWNKFLGDGIMFFYNGLPPNPTHARDAIRTVLQMHDASEDLNQRLQELGLPNVAMRAGIVTGEMVVGDAGSNRAGFEAADYTVLGDDVNLAARLESANKALGTRTLMTERTLLHGGKEFLCRAIGKLIVVGKTQGEMIWEPLAPASEATDEHKALAAQTQRMVDAFVHRRFDDVITAAEQMQDRFGPSKLAVLYLEQSRQYRMCPPGDDFAGTITLLNK